MGKKVKNKFSYNFVFILLIFWSISQFYPMIWVLYSSLKTNKQMIENPLLPTLPFHFENYPLAWSQNDMGIHTAVYFRNSVIIAFSSIIILLLVATLAGYGFAKFKFRGRNILFFLLIGLLAIPPHSTIIPLHFFIKNINLLNKHVGLILVYVAFALPFSVVLLQAYFRTFPTTIVEAAKIDGCSNLQAFFRIVIPMSRGAIIAVGIVNFISLWNDLLLSLIILWKDPVKTLNVGLLGFRSQYVTQWGFIMAALIIAVVPLLTFYLIFNRYITKGMTLGAFKG